MGEADSTFGEREIASERERERSEYIVSNPGLGISHSMTHVVQIGGGVSLKKQDTDLIEEVTLFYG